MSRIAGDRRGRRAWAPRLALAITAATLVWFGALLQFTAMLPRGAPALEASDAIVVLTGGAARVEVGINLLAAGKAKRLLISGAKAGTTKADLMAGAPKGGTWAEMFECCIDLGFAVDTVGNAEETAAWAKANGVRSLRIVTASYHMPRSLLEFHRRMPDAELIPHPVFPEHVKLDQWWRWPGTAALLTGEFDKYVIALVRVRLDAVAEWFGRGRKESPA
jgi:uncharacterized SAM-binding protein YcdF (DUF218 family)